jgi:hypothetical protein
MASGLWNDLSVYGGPDQTYWSVDFVPQLNIARFGTYGRGIWDFAHGSGVSVTTPSEAIQPMNMLDVRSERAPNGPRVRVANADTTAPLQYRWYDLQGRLLGTDETVPLNATLVIVTQGRRVGSAVVPR